MDKICVFCPQVKRCIPGQSSVPVDQVTNAAPVSISPSVHPSIRPLVGHFFVRIKSHDYPFYSKLYLQYHTCRATVLYRTKLIYECLCLKWYVGHEDMVVHCPPLKRHEGWRLISESVMRTNINTAALANYSHKTQNTEISMAHLSK